MGRMTRLQDATFAKTLQSRIMVNIGDSGQMNINMSLIKQKKIPPFYETLSLFQTLPITRQPACGKDVRRQLMWYNLDMQVGHKSLVNEQLVKRNIQVIDEFVDEEGNFLSYGTFFGAIS